VSKAINPAKVVSTAAYLLFYRRRSDRPLGGKLLQEITEASTRANSDDEGDSRAASPSGEGRRLVDSSRNGSTSALAGAGAAHQAGVGGSQAGLRVRSVEVDSSDNEEELPPYESKHQHSSSNFSIMDQPAWSFDNITGPMVSDDDDGLFDDDDDNDSNKAVGGGDMSDLEQHFNGDAGDDTAKFHSVIDDIGTVSDGDEDLPVVELRVNEDDRVVSE
jgi:ubiquitin carboxyl-terminal hydrolase 4/11